MLTYLGNPVSYSIYLFVACFVVLSYGERPLLVVQHIFAPYTVDIARGVGQVVSTGFGIVVLLLQLVMFLFIYLVVKARKGGRKIVLSVLGIFFSSAYFFLVALGYIMPRLH